jgi:hypothetical protein
VCDAREEKKSFVGSIVVRRRTHTERETDWPKPKISTSSHVGISITSRPCVFCVLWSTCRHSKLFCAQHSGRRDGFVARTVSPNYYHTRRKASRDAISDIICRAFLRMRVYFAQQSMLRRRMPSGHTASEKTQDRAQLPALFYCGARAIKCVYEAN